jgi:hypothetical protein
MSGYFRQMRHGNDAKRQLDERLARKEMGDAEYDKQASYADDRAFKIFGLVFIVVLALVFFGIAWMEG